MNDICGGLTLGYWVLLMSADFKARTSNFFRPVRRPVITSSLDRLGPSLIDGLSVVVIIPDGTGRLAALWTALSTRCIDIQLLLIWDLNPDVCLLWQMGCVDELFP